MTIVGSIRPSQLISTFGPGSLVNVENDTVMILGLEFWPLDQDEERFKRVTHPYLSQQLEKNYFKMPVSDKLSAIPCISFPKWGICPKCRSLQTHPRTSKSNKGFFCKFCKPDDQLLLNASFVQICDNGHIQDFPWNRWAHMSEGAGNTVEKKCTKSKHEPDLEFISSKKGTKLSNYIVKCRHCSASRTMYGATSQKTFQMLGFTKCFGSQPWLGKDDHNECMEGVYGVRINSSAVYYSSVVTAMLIPNWIHDIDDVLDADGGTRAARILGDRKDGKSYEDIIEWHKNGIFKEVLKKFTKAEIIERLELRFEPPEKNLSTEGNALEQEFDNFSTIIKKTVRGPPHDLKVDIEPISINSSQLTQYAIDKLMKFHRLISIQVLRGFTRGSPPDPFATEGQINQSQPFRPISSGYTKTSDGQLIPIDWLPAVETRGEGLFFQFDENELQNWEKRPNVTERFCTIINSYAEVVEASNHSDKKSVCQRFDSPRYLLLHTFAHLMIREIADHAGYHEASLRERIYSSSGKDMRNGILIYTSSASSEGSLGGLVRLGDVKTFEEIVQNTITRSRSCSRDPLCEETNPVTLIEEGISSKYLTGSSCYSCTLLPETSCQNFNNLLDRWMLHDPNDGFFRKHIEAR